VVITSTNNASANAVVTKVVVSIITSAAMIVNIRDGIIAVVAVNGIDAHSWVNGRTSTLPKGGLALRRNPSIFSKPRIAAS
jgi:hypothetical protein